MPNYMTELSPDNNTNVYQIKDKEASPIDLLKATAGWVGKNRLQIPASVVTQTVSGVTFTVTRNADGEVTEIDVNGTASARVDFEIKSKPQFSGTKILNGCPSGGSSSTYRILYSNESGSAFADLGDGVEVTKYDDTQYPNNKIVIFVANGYTANHLKFHPMLRDASIIDDTYEPYHASVDKCKFDRAEQRVLGAKNLQDITATTQTKNGVTFTVNADKTITLNGTTTAWTDLNLYPDSEFPQGEYIVSTPIVTNAAYRIWDVTHNTELYNSLTDGESKRITVQANTTLRYLISINRNLTVNGTIKPMLRLASDPDDTYAPYAMTNRELTELATVQESAVTDIISGANVYDNTNYLVKYGKVVQMMVQLDNVTTASAWNVIICRIPENFRPKRYVREKDTISGVLFNIASNGEVVLNQAVSNLSIRFSTTWITS